MEDYKIELGVKLNTSDISEQIGKIDGKHKVKLGVDLGVNDIRDRIKQYNTNTNNIKVKLKATLDTDDLNRQIKKLDLSTGGKGISVPVNTQSLENSLKEVSTIIKDIRNSLGTIDDKSDLKSLVVSVNQIATALEKATNESDGLVASLSALSKKDFSINFGLDIGKKNNNMIAYGRAARKQVMPELESQIKYLENLFGGQQVTMRKLMSQGNNVGFDVFTDFDDFNSDSAIKKMEAMEKYINSLKKLASIDNVDLSGFNNTFSKSATEMINDIAGVEDAVDKAEDTTKRIKNLFGENISAEGLSASLEPIITDLNEIKKVLQEFSNIKPFDGLTQSLKKLDGTLDKLLSNVNAVKKVVDVGLSITSTTDTSNSGVEKVVQDQKELTRASTETANIVVQSEKEKQQAIEETARAYDKISKDTSLARDDAAFKQTFEASNQAAQEAQRHFQELLSEEKAIVSITEQFDNSNALQSFAVNVKRATGEVETLRYAMVNLADKESGEDDDWVFRYQGASSSDKGVERQLESHIKKANDLQIQLDKIKSRYSDMGHAKPIKDADHIESLNAQYKKVEAAIESVRNADNATYYSMVSNAEREKVALENMEREFRNAENVSSSLKGTDLTSGIEIAKNNLEKFKAQAKDFPQITKTVNDLDEAIASVGDKSSLDSFTDQLKVARAELAKVKAETIATNRKEKVGIDVSGATSRIVDIQRISPEIDDFKAKINGAEVTVESLLNDLSKVNTAGDFSVVSKKLRAFEESAKAAGIAVTETVTKASSITKIKDKLKDTGFNGFDQEVARAHAESQKLEGVYDNLEIALHSLDVAMESVYSADQANDVKRLVAANEEYENSLKQVYSQLKLYQQTEKQAFDTEILQQKKASLNSEMEIWLKENSRAAKDFGEEIRRLQSSLDGLDDRGVKLAGQQFKTLTKQAQAMGKIGLTVFDKLKSKVKEYMTYLSAAEMFMYAEQAFRSMFEQVKLIDSAMTELKKVTNETDAAYDKFLTNAASRAKEIGTTIDGLVSSTADFARLGYGFEDAQGLAEVANIYAVVGDEIEDVEGATESLISTMAAFKDEMNGMSNTDFAMSIIDKFNEIGNNFAISSGGIGEALERSASSLMAANNTIDESIALITAANTVVQDPTAVGTAFKTISMRIRGAKTELEEAGLETEGMVDSTAKLRSEILALSGVDIMENANEFKSTYKIMDELAVKWGDLSDIQQATVTELIAGKRQGNIVSSLMTNFDTARDALETSLNSAGSAMKEHEKWQQSLEAQILKLKASWQSLSQSFLSSDFLKVVFDGVINLVDGLTKLIDVFGAFPTLMGTVAAGFSLFKNGGLFKTLDNDLDGFTNKIGIANKSFKELLDAFQSGNKTGGIKGFFDGLKSMGDALVNPLSKVDLSAIDAYNKLLDSGVSSQEAFAKTMNGTSNAAQNLVKSANGSKVALNGMKAATIGSKVALIGAKVAAVAFNAALTMGISLLIDWAVSGIMKLVNAKKDLAEQVEELTSKFQEQSKELQKLRGDYDTTNESSMITKYDRLSKGVDNLGRNVSLTADEYSEYQSIVNKIAEQIPSLVSGYDSQGNAILSCKGNVEELTRAYEDLIKAQNNEVFRNTGNIGEDFANAVKDSEDGGFWNNKLTSNGAKALKEIYDNNYTTEEIDNLLSSIYDDEGISLVPQIGKALEEAGVEVSKFLGIYTWDGVEQAIADTMETNPELIKSIIDGFNADLETLTEGMKSIAQATLSDAFDISNSEYYDMSDTMQSVAKNIVNGFDFEFYKQFKDNPLGVKTYINDMLDQLNALNEKDGAKIEAAFDLQTQFNGGEISYGEYVNGLENTGKLIDGLGLDEELETQLKLSIGLNEKGIVEEYQKLRSRLASNEYFDIMPEDYVPFIESLSAEELSVVWDVIPKLESTSFKEDIDDVKAALEKEMMLQGLTFDLNLEVEAASLEALNTALAESVSATGLSSESITALKGRYASLEAQGYDLSSMFEETSTGIRLNRQEFNKLENAYATDKLAEVDGDLIKMKSTYDDLGEAIKNCDDPIRKSELFNERQTLAKRISEAATLAHQYKGLTNAYNDWLKTEEAGQERDMYENIIKGWETIDDEISRGWIDDGTIEFLELLTGSTDLAGKSGKQLKEIYDGLDKSIGNAGYSIRDFFTVNEDGESTNTGVYNFLETIESLGGKYKNAITKDDNGNIIGFNFEVAGGDEAIAEALGVSEELVQIMVRAADDAGFVVSMDGTYRQLADLQNEAKAAADYLHQIGKTDFEFDFNTSSVESLKTQLEEAHKILDDKKFWNKDGTFNFNADGATQAMQIVSTLQAKLDKLTEEQYGIGLTVEDEEFEEPLENLQDYGHKIATLNQLELNPKANAKEIEKINGELDEIAEYFTNLDKDTKIKLGFESDDGIEEVKKKIESGEVKIPTVLDIQANMDKNLETLADLALLNSGLLTSDEEKVIEKKYKIEAKADEVDTSDVEEKVESTVIDGLGNPILSREANIEIIAEVFDKDVDDLSSKLEGLDDTTVQAIAEAVGQGDVEALDLAVAGMDGNTVDAVCNALGYNDLEELKTAIRNMKGNTVDAKVNTDGQAKKIWTLQDVIDGLKGKTVDIVVNTIKTVTNIVKSVAAGGKKKAAQRTGSDLSPVNGTANVNGTTGRAFKQGSWGTKNSGTALVGELGREVLVRDGRYYTIGDNGAEFIKYKKGDIIFNHVQARELFANGRVTSGSGRGKAFAEGTAFSAGFGGIGKLAKDIYAVDADGNYASITKKSSSSSSSKKSSSSSSSSSSKKSSSSSGSSSSGGGIGKVSGNSVGSNSSNADKFEETIDFVEIAISRVERAIDNLDRKANDVYSNWSSRNKALSDEIGKVNEEIGIQSEAYDEYIQEANSIGLSESWAEKVRNGSIDISTITDETLADKISEYQKWYEKALACKDAVEELKQKEAELYKQRFDNVSAQYDGILNVIEHEKNMLDEYIAQSEAQGHLISAKYYNALISNEKDNITKLQEQKNAMLAELQTAMQSGAITKGSEAWYDMVSAVDEVTLAIEQSNTAILEYQQTIQQLRWESFDILQERISAVTEEADFLIELMSNDRLHDDNGRLTNEGSSTMGLHGQNYNTYMYQADEYAKEAERLKKELAKDPYDTELESRYREMISLQQEHILAAENEKDAIRDLVEEGINLELDALDDRIQKYEEALNSQKDLYDYQKRVEEQTKNIASLQKQMVAYQGDDSEEAKAKIQELKVSLDEAKDDLAETEYEKLISDTESILDDLYLEYENILNTRLDNIDALVSDVISQINADASMISTTLSEKADSVGYTLSESMQTVWDTNSTKINNVITTYGEKFSNAQTTTNNALSAININLQSMITQLNSIANTNVKSAQTSSSVNSKEANATKVPSEIPSEIPVSVDNKKTPTATDLMGIAAAIWVLGGKNSGWGNDPFREGKLTEKLGGKASQVQYLVNEFGANGELYRFYIQNGKNLDKYKYNAFASGKQDILNDQYAWTQENGQELIVRPSDGAILTPLAKGDSVLNASASGNIWNMANNPAEFIKDNLKLDTSNIPNTSSVNNTYTQNFENVTFSMPNVHGYNELLTEMQKDPKFEKLILSMTIDRIAGKSSLAKGKSIR